MSAVLGLNRRRPRVRCEHASDKAMIFKQASQELHHAWILRYGLLKRNQAPFPKRACRMLKDLTRNDKVSKADHSFHSGAYSRHDNHAWAPVVDSPRGNDSRRNRAHFRRLDSRNSQEALTSPKNTDAVMDAVTQL